MVPVGSILDAMTISMFRGQQAEKEVRAKKFGVHYHSKCQGWIVLLKSTQNTFWGKFSGYDSICLFSLLIKLSPTSGVIPGETESHKTHGLHWVAKGDWATDYDLGLIQKWMLNNRPFHQAFITWVSGDGGSEGGGSRKAASLLGGSRDYNRKTPRWKFLGFEDIKQSNEE